MFLCLCLLVSSQAPQSNLDIQEDVQVAPTQVGETQENEKEDLSSVISLISSLAAPTNTPVLPVIQFSPYYACCPMSMWSIELLIQSILFHQNIYTQKDLLHASWICLTSCAGVMCRWTGGWKEASPAFKAHNALLLIIHWYQCATPLLHTHPWGSLSYPACYPAPSPYLWPQAQERARCPVPTDPRAAADRAPGPKGWGRTDEEPAQVSLCLSQCVQLQ